MSETVTEQTEGEPVEPATEPDATPDETVPPDEEESEPLEEQEEAPPVQEPAADENDPRIIESQKKWVNFESAIRKIWGDYAQYLTDCPLCFESHKGLLDLNDSGQYPEEVLAAIVEYARGARQVELRDDPETNECPTCGGVGKLLTRGHVPGHEERQCKHCAGYGYVPPPVPQASTNGPPPAAVVLSEPGVTDQPLVVEDADIWGSPRLLPTGAENPNYGKMPQYKNRELP